MQPFAFVRFSTKEEALRAVKNVKHLDNMVERFSDWSKRNRI